MRLKLCIRITFSEKLLCLYDFNEERKYFIFKNNWNKIFIRFKLFESWKFSQFILSLNRRVILETGSDKMKKTNNEDGEPFEGPNTGKTLT
jgi:hypothetical protein